MLTKERLGRVRTILLTIVAASGLVGMTLQPALAKAPDIARPAIAVADLDLSALIAQLRSMVLNLQARIDELEKALAEAPPPADEADEDDTDEAEVEDVDDGTVDEVDQPEADDVDDDSIDKDVEETGDHEDADDRDADEADEDKDEHQDEDKDEHQGKSGKSHESDDDHDGGDEHESDEDDD